jgi:dimethylargininase
MRIALTREVSPGIERCELTHLARAPIDFDKAREQHRHYVNSLSQLGCRVQVLPPAPEHPDAVFIEDTAVVLDELAVITRPGAESRRGETGSVALALLNLRELFTIEEPGTLDGGDVLAIGRTLFVGLSERTNQSGIEQLQRVVAEHDYSVVPVEFGNCLHLKSAVTQISDDTIIINPAWVRPDAFPGMSFVEVAPAEPMAANALLLGDTVIYPAEHPRTRERMEAQGVRVLPVPASELSKAEGGVTC